MIRIVQITATPRLLFWRVLFIFGLNVALAAHLEASPGLKCVQNQLIASGYDVGDANRIQSTKLQDALQEYALFTNLELGNPLDFGNADSYCRRIGLIDISLQRFWPSVNGRLEFVFDARIPNAAADLIQTYTSKYLESIVDTLKLDLSGTDTVLVGTNVNSITRMLFEVVDFDPNELAKNISVLCSSSRGIGGQVVPGVFYICLNPEKTISISDIQYLIAHEIVHLVQIQIGGAVRSDSKVDFILQNEGPIWMKEGFAQVIAVHVVQGLGPNEIQTEMMQRYSGMKLADLNTLELDSAQFVDPEGVYITGTIAAASLLKQAGFVGYAKFLEKLASGMPWQQAFEIAFKQSTRNFYREFSEIEQ